MPTEVYEDSIDLEIGLIEAENLRPDGGEAHRSSYPYPVLHPVPDRAVSRTFPTVVLENAYLKATFVPALGGRLLRLFDKGLNRDILPAPTRLMAESGGPRGALLRAGVQVLTGTEERHSALAETPFQLDPPSDDEPIGVWFFGIERDLSFHAHWTLEPDRAQLVVLVRTLNRSFIPADYNGGLLLALQQGNVAAIKDGFIWDGGLGIWPEELPFDAASWQGAKLQVFRFRKEQAYRLGRRQVETWSSTLTPTVRGAQFGSKAASARLESQAVTLRGSLNFPGKVFLQTVSGQTLESEVDVRPNEETILSLPESSPELALQMEDRGFVFRSDTDTPMEVGSLWESWQPKDSLELYAPSATGSQLDMRDFSDGALRRATAEPSLRAATYVLRAMKELALTISTSAAETLETALLFNAEDPLAWWLRAAALRQIGPWGWPEGQSPDSGQDLLNAHFLAPLEPALRAESFLSQNVQPGREPAAILKPFADQPEAFLEVACLLLDAGLMEDTQRWIDEALRHSDLALLRYLLAHAYLESSRMHVEAAQQVAQAGKIPVGPPYPWRRMEKLAVRSLAKAFPEDTNLAEFVALLDALT